jgi:hypothetical protein
VSKLHLQSKTVLDVTSVKIDWDIEEYVHRLPNKNSSRFKRDFPDLNLGYQNMPAVIIDSKGRIVIWYLPRLLGKHHTVSAIQCK